MVRKLLVLFLALVVFGFVGCKKHPEEGQADSVKPMSEFEAEAKKTISKENMDDELAKIEKEIESEISREK